MYKRAIRRKLKAGEVVNFKLDGDAADALNYLRAWARREGSKQSPQTVSELVRWALRRVSVQVGRQATSTLDSAAFSYLEAARCQRLNVPAPTVEQPPQGDDCD